MHIGIIPPTLEACDPTHHPVRKVAEVELSQRTGPFERLLVSVPRIVRADRHAPCFA